MSAEHTRLYEQAARDAGRMKALVDVGTLLSETLDPATVAQRIVKHVRELLATRVAGLYRMRPDGQVLEALAFAGSAGLDAIPEGKGVAGLAVRRRQPVTTLDLLNDPEITLDPAARDRVERAGYRAAVGVPLVVKDRVIGALALGDHLGRSFVAEDISLVQAFAAHAAVALHNAELYEDARAAHQAAEERQVRLQAVLATSQQLSRIQSIESLLRAIAEACGQLVGAPSGGFRLVEGDELIAVAAFGDGAEIRVTPRFKLGEGLSGVVATSGEPMIVNDVAADPRILPSHRAAIADGGPQAWLGVPIKAGDRVIGVLSLRTPTPNTFSAADVAIATAFASQAAVALENGRLYAEARRAVAELEAKNNELDSFVYTVSHDLRSPIAAIDGLAALVLDDEAATLGTESRRYLERIRTNTDRMARLISDVLALSRIGKDTRSAETIDVTALVEEVLEEVEPQRAARGIAVAVADLGVVVAVRTELEQVFRNLVTNAVKYMGDTETPRLAIGAREQDHVREYFVEDTGIGIDPAYHAKIFELFQRLQEIPADGTGVGLPIVKKVVEAAGGRVWVESTPGRGTTMRFTWPLPRWELAPTT